MKITRLLEIRPVKIFPRKQSENTLLESKVQELVQAIGQAPVDSHRARIYQEQISEAFENAEETRRKIAPFRALDEDNSLSREELLEGLEKLLAENQIDSKISSGHPANKGLQKGVILILAVILITTGFAMIIMPAPASFEIATIFYFTPQDGVTVMDLVSLLIIFGGVLLIVLNFNKK
ncbi:hypothetical protein DYBT9623_01384 [Dyadobacter sp. CECT 9623]|uniref:Uncharacterized protein n=1 Tax=Dyadobacter linearis TaxID=2823330 RepID=A0ABM8UMM9_9BACT|nr:MULTISPECIES: hypothetical protein [unclassified Dyadobacter]MCE7059892.1 hypothetical protein [Dyadobacter sp. CY343]CAG5068652.1 hypothetical protein DYBT9623_01384 [Dyadobacter sp. CECT 9623]